MQQIKTMADMMASGEQAEVLFWVGCAGSFDQRAQKITKAFTKILQKCDVKFAVLGAEEGCTGDPARRAGNEFIFQMLAMNNIATMNSYEVKKIVTTCPHCFNVLLNEYPKLGGQYEVMHHTTFLQDLIDAGRLKLTDADAFKGKKITYHDSCYIGRSNGIYEAPRKVLENLDAELVEMRRCKSKGLCCGAGGAQMFKEDEPGDKRINAERIEDAVETRADMVATACPFCMTMMSDGVKTVGKEEDMTVMDIAELIAQAEDLI